MKLKLAICDDEQSQIESLTALVLSWGETAGHICEIRAFSSAEAFLFAYEDDKAYDVLLLDVEMNGMTGIELAKHIRGDGNRAEIVFVTSHFEFAGEGYEVDALHYLTKPIVGEKLAWVLTKAATKRSAEPPSVVISCAGATVKLYESDIRYVESFLHYVVIHTKDKEYRIKESISAVEGRLSEDFYRVHRSYIVSLKYVTRISRKSIYVEKTELPMARGRYDDVNRAFIARN